LFIQNGAVLLGKLTFNRVFDSSSSGIEDDDEDENKEEDEDKSFVMSKSTLEAFLCDYLAVAGGVWDEVEPQVYDVLLPETADEAAAGRREPGVLRVAFDPEALPEHPRAQLATLGTPLVDRLLADAVEQGRGIELHVVGLNLQPYQLAAKAARGFQLLDAPSPRSKVPEELKLDVNRIRALDAPQLVFWFEATFTTDQREQELIPIAVDEASGRPARHLDRILDPARLAEESPQSLPLMAGAGRLAAYRTAREQVIRTVSSLANLRTRELDQRLARQEARMTRYYGDLAAELEQQRARAVARDEDTSRFDQRREAMERERQVRIAELRRRSALSVQLRLLNLLVVHQPKLRIEAQAVSQAAPSIPLALTFDPLLETMEAADCPGCSHPTFELHRRQNQLLCPSCAATFVPHRPR
jgi:hypothetical protein